MSSISFDAWRNANGVPAGYGAAQAGRRAEPSMMVSHVPPPPASLMANNPNDSGARYGRRASPPMDGGHINYQQPAYSPQPNMQAPNQAQAQALAQANAARLAQLKMLASQRSGGIPGAPQQGGYVPSSVSGPPQGARPAPINMQQQMQRPGGASPVPGQYPPGGMMQQQRPMMPQPGMQPGMMQQQRPMMPQQGMQPGMMQQQRPMMPQQGMQPGMMQQQRPMMPGAMMQQQQQQPRPMVPPPQMQQQPRPMVPQAQVQQQSQPGTPAAAANRSAALAALAARRPASNQMDSSAQQQQQQPQQLKPLAQQPRPMIPQSNPPPPVQPPPQQPPPQPKPQPQTYRQGPAKASNIEDLPVAGSKGFSAVPPELAKASQGPGGPMTECHSCGRTFNPVAYAKHAKICNKVFVQKRKVFNTQHARVAGTELEKFVGKSKAPAKKPAAPPGKKAKWKAQSDQLRQAMAASRAIKEAEARGEDISKMAMPEMDPENDDRVPCPYCGRKFAALTAERHIPHCKNTKAKPNGPGRPGLR